MSAQVQHHNLYHAQQNGKPRQILAICLDSGDTLVDEGTEIKDENQVTQCAELLPGAADLVRELKNRGYRLALVADGPVGTFQNVLGHYALYDLFDVRAISAEVGVEKPDERIFQHALDLLEIPPQAYNQVLMVGNHLGRDIKGANAVGMISVWLDWAPRRAKTPADASEVPQYIIKQPLELLSLLDALEQ